MYSTIPIRWVAACSPSPPPPPPPPGPPTSRLARVAALYPYRGEADNSLAMVEGEQFQVMEADTEGWTRVRRDHQSGKPPEEGFVPTSFLRDVSEKEPDSFA